jgi:hypothetical protein
MPTHEVDDMAAATAAGQSSCDVTSARRYHPRAAQARRSNIGLRRLAMLCELATTFAIAPMVGPASAVARAAGLPTLYCNVVSHDNNQTFSPVFSVRPRIVIVDSADGGELVIRWATWTHASATGTGTAHPDHGQYPVGVRASDAVGGRFMHLAITSDLDGRHYVDHLHLAYVIGDALGWER